MTRGERIATIAANLALGAGVAAMAVSVTTVARAGTPAPGGGGCGAWAAIGWFTGCSTDYAHPPPRPPESVAITLPETRGDLDARLVRRTLRLYSDKLLGCYVVGPVDVAFSIGLDGHVFDSQASVPGCIAGAIGAIRFPRADGFTEVHARLQFSPPAAARMY